MTHQQGDDMNYLPKRGPYEFNFNSALQVIALLTIIVGLGIGYQKIIGKLEQQTALGIEYKATADASIAMLFDELGKLDDRVDAVESTNVQFETRLDVTNERMKEFLAAVVELRSEINDQSSDIGNLSGDMKVVLSWVETQKMGVR